MKRASTRSPARKSVAPRRVAGRRRIWLARPRGFCAGVCRALATVDAALARFGRPVYVNHELVHNRHVADDLRQRGVVVGDDLAAVPPERPLIFSAHGVAAKFAATAKSRGLTIIDATCPLVAKVHRQARRAEREGRPVILIGHRGHPEVLGTMGQMTSSAYLVETPADVVALPELSGSRIMVLTQTTLTPEDVAEVHAALARRFPGFHPEDDLCYATRSRQAAVRALAEHCPVILVVGSAHSSNSRRLVEVARRAGARAEMLDHARELRPAWLRGCTDVGITAAASTPERLVEELVAHLRRQGWDDVRELPGEDEQVAFRLPKIPGGILPSAPPAGSTRRNDAREVQPKLRTARAPR